MTSLDLILNRTEEKIRKTAIEESTPIPMNDEALVLAAFIKLQQTHFDDSKEGNGSQLVCNIIPLKVVATEVFSPEALESVKMSHETSSTEQHITKLEETADVEWRPRSKKAKSINTKTRHQLFPSRSKPQPFQKHIEQLLEYKRIFGHTNVSRGDSVEWRSLAHWVNNQRSTYRVGKLPEDKIQLLESIGFSWEVRTPRKYFQYQLPDGTLHVVSQGTSLNTRKSERNKKHTIIGNSSEEDEMEAEFE